jgi:integrase/recombinase XerD
MSALRYRMIEDMKLAGLAEETQRAYIRAVRQLTAHYGKPPDQLSEEEVRTYLLALIDQRVARGTFKSTRFGVQFFYQQTLGLKWELFAKRIRLPRQKRLPEVLSDDEVRRLLGCIRNPVHRSALAVMYACGLRISEAASIQLKSIDSAERLLSIIGKGNKERKVPLPSPMLADLRALWRQHRNPCWLFPNRRNDGPVDVSVLTQTFHNAAGRAGLPPGVTPHALRHSYATRLLESGINLRVVQILLGHQRLSSTAVYTHLTEPMRASLKYTLDRLMAGL